MTVVALTDQLFCPLCNLSVIFSICVRDIVPPAGKRLLLVFHLDGPQMVMSPFHLNVSAIVRRRPATFRETRNVPSKVASTVNPNTQQLLQKRTNQGAEPGPKETTFHPVKAWKMRQGKLTYISYFCLKLDAKSCICASDNIKLWHLFKIQFGPGAGGDIRSWWSLVSPP